MWNIPEWAINLFPDHIKNNLEDYKDTNILNFYNDERYVDSFSYEWNKHKKTQLGINRVDLMNEDMWNGKINASEYQFISPKITLDAGCGVGRFTEYTLNLGGRVIGVDLSEAVYSARENIISSEAQFMRADLNQLPFREEVFDNIISIGVIHHTPNPKETFENLVRYLKPGGSIFIWVYGDTPDYHKRFKLTKYLSKIPKDILYMWVEDIITSKNLLTHTKFKTWALKNLPLPDKYSTENQILDTFDAYSPKYNFYFNEEEVTSWFYNAGLINVTRNSFPTSICGQKPFNAQLSQEFLNMNPHIW